MKKINANNKRRTFTLNSVYFSGCGDRDVGPLMLFFDCYQFGRTVIFSNQKNREGMEAFTTQETHHK